MRSSGGTYLYRRKNGRYYVGQRLNEKIVWRSTGETTRSAALKVLKETAHHLARTTHGESFKVFSERFLVVALQMFAPKTVEIYRRTLKGFQRVVGDCIFAELTGEHWDRFKAERLTTISPASVNIELRALRAVLNTAVRWNLLTANPFARRKFVPVPEVLPPYFTMNDIAKLRAIVTNPLYWDIILFAVLSGSRRGEILALRWSDYDDQRSTMTIHCSNGFRTKTGRHRVIPVHSLLYEMLEKRRNTSQCDLIFSDNGHQLRGNNVTKRIRHYIRKAGLRRELHFHSLRHSFASLLVQSGESLYMVQKLLGHTSPRMTQVYSHLEPTNLHRSIERIVMH
jgi:integrase